MGKKRYNVFAGKPILLGAKKRKPTELWDRMTEDLTAGFLRDVKGENPREFRERVLKLASQMRSIGQNEGREERDRMICGWYEDGIIKQRPLVEYFMQTLHLTKTKAVRYIAELYGMKENTQSVYLSEEFEARQRERKQTKSKKEF